MSRREHAHIDNLLLWLHSSQGREEKGGRGGKRVRLRARDKKSLVHAS